MDAGADDARRGPEEASRFACEEEVTSSIGLREKFSRPPGFLVVAEHVDNMSFSPRLLSGESSMLAEPTGKKWNGMVQAEGQEGKKAAVVVMVAFRQDTFPPALVSRPGSRTYRPAWEEPINAAEVYDDPRRFKAFIG